MERKTGRPWTALLKYEKLILSEEETTSAVGCGVSCAVLYALRPFVQVTVRRRVSFIF